jgi:hypothetical protein
LPPGKRPSGLDGPDASAYLKRTMLRRLLACLALLTGLAAVSAPAHANLHDAMGAQLELTQKAEDSGKSDTITCAERQRKERQRGERVTPCRPGEGVRVVIPTVMIGVDRSAE